MRRPLRRSFVAALTGALTVGVAWASAGIVPVRPSEDALDATRVVDEARQDTVAGEVAATPGEIAVEQGNAPIPAPETGLVAGASKVSIEPQPGEGDVWETDHDACATLSPEGFQALFDAPPDSMDHLADAGSPWPENPDCIYMGGFGIGPMNPATSWDQEYGLWVRAFALSDGEDTLVLAVVDGEGYFWDYANKCDDCGSKQIAARLGEQLGIDPAGIVIAATHAHSAPDFIGGWGFVPDWYMEQVTAAIEQAITEAVLGARPAALEAGEERARDWNSERRGTYRSAEEQQVGWIRAVAVDDKGRVARTQDGEPDVIATLGTYAAHPTRWGTNDGTAHPDWPGLFVDALEERFGGVGLQIMTGLGNMSGAGSKELMGEALAALLPDAAQGRMLEDTDIRVQQRVWRQPATNVPLTALAVPGFFDHTFAPQPAQVAVGKSDNAPCTSASPYSVEVPASAAWIGDELAITAAPGETFSNLSNTIKEESGARVTLPLAQANDALGYIPQSFEHDRVGQQGLGFAVDGAVFVNYEDSYAIDHCFGDMVLETTLEMLAELR